MKHGGADEIIEEVSVNYEKELVKRIQKDGDRDAFYKLVKLYDSKVYSIAYRFLGNRDDALETAQDVFVQVYRKIRQYRGEVPFKYWLQKIAVNYSLNRIRSMKRDVLKYAGEVRDDYGADNLRTPENIAEHGEKNEFLKEALMKLSLPYRSAVVLKDLEGYSYAEMAKLMKVSMGTVKSRLARGREELRNIINSGKKEVQDYGLQGDR
jgi:RNA polymerase sigma-70 factor, ECF subfamily